MSKNKNGSMVGVLEELTVTTLPAKIQSMVAAGQLTKTAYMNLIRHSLNNVLIEITLGCSIEMDGGKTKVKFNKHLPTIEDLSKTTKLLTDYMALHENRIMELFRQSEIQAAQAQGQPQGQPLNDMAILPEQGVPQKHVMMVEKPTNKNLKNMLKKQGVLGADILDSSDVMELASMGRKARKRSNTMKAIIIGTTALVVIGGVVTGILVYRHHKRSEEEALDEAILNEDIPIDEDVNVPMLVNCNIPSLDNTLIPGMDTPNVVL